MQTKRPRLRAFFLVLWSVVFLVPLIHHLYDLAQSRSYELAAELTIMTPEFIPLIILSAPTGILLWLFLGVIEVTFEIIGPREI